MSFEEKRSWIMLVTAVGGYATYLAVILGRANGAPLSTVDYQWPLLWTIGAAILASIVAVIVVSIAAPRDAGRKDQRDREINRFGEYVGQSFVVLGALVALLLAMLSADRFWIANAIYLSFVLSALLGAATKIVAYRRGFQ